MDHLRANNISKFCCFKKKTNETTLQRRVITSTLNTILLHLNDAASIALISAEDLCKSRRTVDKYVNENTFNTDEMSILFNI